MSDVRGRPGLDESPAWLSALAAALVAGSCSQLAYALHPRTGPFVGYLEVVAVIVVGIWGVWRLSRRGLTGLRWPPWPVWALIVIAALSAFNAVSLKAAGVEIAQLLLYFVALYVLFCEAFTGKETLVAGAASVAVGVGALAALAQMGNAAADPMQVRGLAGNRNIYSAFMAFMLPLPWAWACWRWPGRGAWLAGGAVGAAMLTMFGPPHVWIAIVVLTGIAAWIMRQHWWRLAAPVLGVVIVANFACPALRACNVDEFLNPWETGNVYKLLREAGADDQTRLVKKRWLEWWAALAMIADKPLLGVGVGNYQKNIGMAEYWGYMPNAKKTEPDTNNLYLVIAGSMGLPGLAALLAMLALFIRRATRAWREGAGWLAAGVAGALVSWACVNVFTATLVRGAAVALVALLAVAGSLKPAERGAAMPSDAGAASAEEE